MPTFSYAKLVRDKIPEWHAQSGHTVHGTALRGDELRVALCKKLHEESDEVTGALTREDLIEEIGDVQQVINDLCIVLGISKDELQASMTHKSERKGGFLNGEYIETVTIPNEEDEWADYCRRSPDKYPEVAV